MNNMDLSTFTGSSLYTNLDEYYYHNYDQNSIVQGNDVYTPIDDMDQDPNLGHNINVNEGNGNETDDTENFRLNAFQNPQDT